MTPAFGHFHDDGVYLSTAHALASGKGYVHESLPVEIAQTKYPVLYPAILAGFWWFSDSPFVVAFCAKVLSFVALLLWLLLVRKLLRRWIAEAEVLDWICFFTLAMPWVLYVGTSALPDSLFSLLCASCLAAVLREPGAEDQFAKPYLFGAAVCGAGAFLIRTTGIAILLAVTIYLWRRRWKDGLLFAVISGVMVAPWLVWQAAQAAPLDPVQIYYSKLSYATGQIFSGYSGQEMASVVLFNLTMLLTQFLVWMPALPFGLALLGGLGLAAAGMVGAWRGWRRDEAVVVWVILYCGVLLCWIWPPFRYATPVLPFGLALVVGGGGPWLRRWLPGHWLRTGVVLLAVVALSANVAGAKRSWQLGTTVVGWADADDWAQNRAMLEWLRENTPESAVVAANLDPLVYLLTGRKAIKPFEHLQYELNYAGSRGPSAVGTAEEIVAHFRRNGITHLLVSPMNNFTEKRHFAVALQSLLAGWPTAFRKVREIPNSGYVVYEVKQEELQERRGAAQTTWVRPAKALATASSNAAR